MLIFWLYGVYLKARLIWIKVVNINLKCEGCSWIFNSKSNLTKLIVAQTPSEMNIKGIWMRYADFLNLLSLFDGTVNMN